MRPPNVSAGEVDCNLDQRGRLVNKKHTPPSLAPFVQVVALPLESIKSATCREAALWPLLLLRLWLRLWICRARRTLSRNRFAARADATARMHAAVTAVHATAFLLTSFQCF